MNSPHPKCVFFLARVASIAGLAFGFSSLPAAESDAAKPSGDELLKLKDFVVSTDRDVGYTATNAIGVTRTNTALMDIPQMVNVINRQFLDDIGAGELYDALRYVSGVSEGSNTGDGFQIRGYALGTPYTDGLPDYEIQSQMGAEPFLYERIEVLKGPNALVYGSHAAGGVVNKVRKTPQWDAAGLLAFTVGNHGQFKTELDDTRPISDHLAYRVIGVYRTENLVDGVPTRFAWAHRWNASPMLTWRPTSTTQLRVVGEFLRESAFKHFGDAFMLQPFTTSTGANVIVSGLSQTSFKLLPRDFTVSDPQARADNKKAAFLISFETSPVTDWSIHLTTYGEWWNHDSLDVANQGVQANNTLLNRNWPFTQNWQYDLTTSLDSIYRFNLAFSSHKILFVSQFNHEAQDASTFQGGSVTSGSLFLIPVALNIYNPVYGNLGPFVPRVESAASVTANESWGTGLQDEIWFWDNKLMIVGGARYDWYTTQTNNLLTPTVFGVTNQGAAWTKKYGALFRPIRSLSVYADHTETYVPNFGANPDGQTFVPSYGLINEVGIKTEGFLGGRISTTVSYFDLVENNLLLQDPIQPLAILGYRVQTARQDTRGFESDTFFNVTQNLQVMVSGATMSIVLPTNLQPRNSPKKTAAALAKYRFLQGPLKRLAVGAGWRWQGTVAAEAGNQVFFPPYHTFDAFANYGWGRYTLALDVSNVTNEWYLDRGVTRNAYFQGPNRLIKFRVSMKF